MNPNLTRRIVVDGLMTAALLLLMACEQIGTLAHEVLGTGVFLLFLLHHLLNRAWILGLSKGRYTPRRMIQTALVFLLLITMLGSAVSGVVLSEHLFKALPIRGGRAAARVVHMLCAYWGFALMSLHLGLHWGMVVNAPRRARGGKRFAHPCPLRGLAGLIALYGLRAFWVHDIGSYMLLRTHFVFFDFDRPLILFLLDYMAVMGLFVFCAYYAGMIFRRKKRENVR